MRAHRGTGSSNPLPSTSESGELRIFREPAAGGPISRAIRNTPKPSMLTPTRAAYPIAHLDEKCTRTAAFVHRIKSFRPSGRALPAKVVSHGRYVTSQMAEVAVSRQMFKDILMVSARLRAPPAPA
jgi:hypothetical protein